MLDGADECFLVMTASHDVRSIWATEGASVFSVETATDYLHEGFIEKPYINTLRLTNIFQQMQYKIRVGEPLATT